MHLVDFLSRGAAFVAIAGAAVHAAVTPTVAPHPDAGDAVPNSRLIFLKPGVNEVKFKNWVKTAIGNADNKGASIATVNSEGSGTIQKEFRVETANFAVITGIFDDKFVAKAKNRPEVADVFPNLIHHIVGDQPNPLNKGLPKISSRTQNATHYYFPDSAGKGVRVYILDTGIRVTHNDFQGRASLGMTAVSGTADARDDNGHGTHVSAIVGGTKFGVAKRVSLTAIKVCSAQGTCTTQDIVEGITWMINDSRRNGRGKSIANLSLGGAADAALDRAVQAAMEAGVAFAVAAGNGRVDACTGSPARVAGVVTVGASDPQDRAASFSNFGKCLDILAPGVSILSASNGANDATATLSGTSMSSPFAAGVLAIIAGEGTFNVKQLTNTLVQMGTKGALQNLGAGTPNLLLYNGGKMTKTEAPKKSPKPVGKPRPVEAGKKPPAKKPEDKCVWWWRWVGLCRS